MIKHVKRDKSGVIRIGIITDRHTKMLASLPKYFEELRTAYKIPWGSLHIVVAKSDSCYEELYQMFETKQVSGIYIKKAHSEILPVSHFDILCLKQKNVERYRKCTPKGHGFLVDIHNKY